MIFTTFPSLRKPLAARFDCTFPPNASRLDVTASGAAHRNRPGAMTRCFAAGVVAALSVAGVNGTACAAAAAQRFAFNGEPAGTAVETSYTEGAGFGLLSRPGSGDFAFSVKAAPGDYQVTLTLRSDRPLRAMLWAEDRRLATTPVELASGVTVTRRFLVNVRNPELVKVWTDLVSKPTVSLGDEEARGRAWDDQLTVSLAGLEDAIRAIEIQPVAARRILLAGDSTVASQAKGDAASWGQMLARFIDPALVVANHARNGHSLKSFLTSLRWDKLTADIRPGDIVILQFGHNDEKKEHARTYSAPDQAYSAFLAAMVADVRQHGGFPVLATPVARRTFNAAGTIENSHMAYDEAVRTLAMQRRVPLIDLTAMGTTMYQALGPALAPQAFAQGGQDPTHHNAYGAYVLACLVARGLHGHAELKVGLADAAPACTPSSFPSPSQYELRDLGWSKFTASANPGPSDKPGSKISETE
ncbi:rhamnogalacturonan acetylesterase [Pseudoduganella sp. LjRoot289]|uniref:rhamnogalacturonan acetylesterase n=1 Tax=Pseudoduganella sp. LjRoot289 TaxID=3342314 RepID=UPI003ECC5052